MTSIDADPDLVATARARLGAAGYPPVLAFADGLDGYPAGAPYDRIIATCSVTHIPRTWIEQTRPGGLVLAPLDGGLGNGMLALLEVKSEEAARGRFLHTPVAFMLLRTSNTGRHADLPCEAAAGRSTQLSPAVLDDWTFTFFAQLFLPKVQRVDDPHGGTEITTTSLVGADGSWAVATGHDDGGHIVDQGGPRRLWDLLEQAHATWLSLHKPRREWFTLTVTP